MEDTGCFLPDGQSLQSTLKRGWYWGSEYFKEQLLERFSDFISEKTSCHYDGMSAMKHDRSEGLS